MSSILIRNARVLSPADHLDRVMNVYVENGVITELDSSRAQADTVLEADGLVLAPGSGGYARPPAGSGPDPQGGYPHRMPRQQPAGGFTAVVCMPNTNPPIDSAEAHPLYPGQGRTGRRPGLPGR